jgi:acyl carrier protein
LRLECGCWLSHPVLPTIPAAAIAITPLLVAQDVVMTNTPDPLKQDIKRAIVQSLRLPISVDEIGDDTPLFGEGLGLDSIDVLELVLELERSFGVSIGDEQTGIDVLQSVDTIAAFIVKQRADASA